MELEIILNSIEPKSYMQKTAILSVYPNRTLSKSLK